MKIAIVKKSSITMLDNWSAEFNIEGDKLIKKVLSMNLTIPELEYKLRNIINFLKSHRDILNITIKKDRNFLSCVIGGFANNKNSITLEKVFEYMKSSCTGEKDRLLKGVIVGLVLMQTVKDNESDINEFIDKELERVIILRNSLSKLVNMS